MFKDQKKNRFVFLRSDTKTKRNNLKFGKIQKKKENFNERNLGIVIIIYVKSCKERNINYIIQ